MWSKENFVYRVAVACMCVLASAILCSCSEEENNAVEYYDIVSQVDCLFAADPSKERRGMLLGMQYYQGEPVQLWSDRSERNAVYLARKDGSREKLMEIPRAGAMCCYLDRDGSIYCWERYAELAEDEMIFVWKYDASGQEICRVRMEEGIFPEDICQLSDGRILLLLRDKAWGMMRLGELDAGKGAVSRLDQVMLGKSTAIGYIAPGRQGLAFLEQGYWEGISEISLKEGKKETAQSFQGGSYILGMNTEGMELQDFRMTEDGNIEILWASPDDGGGVLETLQLSKMEKTVLIMQTTLAGNFQWMKEKIAEFNKRSESYYVILQYPDSNAQIEYGQMIAMQMAAGKGPDILTGYALDFVDDLAGKGGIVDLAPYMEESGMREEDYFPFAFSRWRNGDKIYTVSFSGYAMYDWLDGRSLGLEEKPDIGTLLDVLLAVEEPGNYLEVSPASGVLIDLLKYTDDFCGILSWEEGSCDFKGELFAKMMRTAAKYGYTMNEITEKADEAFSKPCAAGKMIVTDIYVYETMADIEAQGKIPLLSANGNPHGCSSSSNIFAVNANSAHVEGAWEFLAYMMSEEVQRSQNNPMEATNRAVCKEAVEKEIHWLEEGNVKYISFERITTKFERFAMERRSWTREQITDEKAAEYISMRDRAEPRDTEEDRRMKPVWQIIREESEAYFTGDKSIEEVADIITNRVQLYLDENR